MLPKLSSFSWFNDYMVAVFVSKCFDKHFDSDLLLLTCAGERPLSARVSGWPDCEDVVVGNQSADTA